MRRNPLVHVLSVAVVALVIAGCGGSSGGSTSSSSPQVHTAKTSLGSLLVAPSGRTLYRFAKDTAPGQVNGQGVKDAWYVLLPDGTMNKEAAAMSTATPAS